AAAASDNAKRSLGNIGHQLLSLNHSFTPRPIAAPLSPERGAWEKLKPSSWAEGKSLSADGGSTWSGRIQFHTNEISEETSPYQQFKRCVQNASLETRFFLDPAIPHAEPAFEQAGNEWPTSTEILKTVLSSIPMTHSKQNALETVLDSVLDKCKQ